MGMSPQQKLLHVAKKLGLSSLKDMQGSTRVVYDQNTTSANVQTLFEGAANKSFPNTNLGASGNRFQTNEALLIEKIGFYEPSTDGKTYAVTAGLSYKFDLIIGNKTVLKDVVVEYAGQQAFSTTIGAVIDLESAGIVIPPNVEFKVIAKAFTTDGRAAASKRIGAYLYGTAALLTFNTSI